MPSSLPVRLIREEEIELYARSTASGSAPEVNLPTFGRTAQRSTERQHVRHARATNSSQKSLKVAALVRPTFEVGRPHLVPSAVPSRQSRHAPLLVRANRALRTVLVAFCGIAILGYGLDVATSNDVSRLQEQARRLNEENCEKSAQLLKAISFKGIQDNVVGKFGLHVPEQVIIAPEVKPPQLPGFKPSKHSLPVMAGY
jgi:hypothetical protein